MNTITVVFFAVILLSIVSLFLFIVITYVTIQWFDVQSHYYRVMYYNHTTNTQQMIDLYGSMPIKKVYLVREPFTPLIQILLKCITGYELNDSTIYHPFHYSLLFEVVCPNGCVKLIRLEKNSSINLTPCVSLQRQVEMLPFNLMNNTTIEHLLNETLSRIGHARFFNWCVSKNNCRVFIKDMLKTMHQYTSQHKSFIYSNKDNKRMLEKVVPTKFAKHVINTIVNVYDICIHYIS